MLLKRNDYIMKRREFVKTLVTSTGTLVLGSVIHCQAPPEMFNVFPKGNPPKKLYVLNFPNNVDWHEKNFLTCFQGLINRHEARVYFLHTKADEFWLNYYKEKFGIQYEKVATADDLIGKFVDEIAGCVVYDTDMPQPAISSKNLPIKS